MNKYKQNTQTTLRKGKGSSIRLREYSSDCFLCHIKGKAGEVQSVSYENEEF